MGDTTTLPASVAAEKGTLKRAISMAWFATKQQKAQCALTEKPITLGQIVGAIYAVKGRPSTKFLETDGTPKIDLVAIGEFEAVNYTTGETIEANACYLPRYYVETLKEAMEAGSRTVATFAVEIVLEPTGKEIPVAYVIRNLAARRADNPLEVLKRELAGRGMLRLPAPVPSDPRIAGLVDAEGSAPLLEGVATASNGTLLRAAEDDALEEMERIEDPESDDLADVPSTPIGRVVVKGRQRRATAEAAT